jgi:anti-anti-sigma factor
VPQTPFELESANDGETGRVKLSGELDIATVPRVEAAVKALLAGGARRMTIDLSTLDFIDSSGLRLCIVLDQRAAAEGWTLTFTRPRAQPATVFEVSGVEGELPFAAGPSAACVDGGDVSDA